jgi:hypothetical protein
MKLAIVILLLLAGCMTRKPNQAYPWTTHAEAIDDVVYYGVGYKW